MFDIHTPVSFFLGANTPSGFLGYLDDLYDGKDGWRAYLIKSGPGTGKSSLMRAVLNRMTELGEDAEAIFCSSDPHSLDGVVLRRLKLCIFDATSPHIIEPKYWGAVETIVDLGSCMDSGAIHAQADAVIAATDACSGTHRRCCKFLGAASSLLSDSARIALACTDTEKIVRAARRLAQREFPSAAKQKGRETRRFLSAITPEGPVIFHETIQTLCSRIYSIEDEYGASSRLLLAELRRLALDAGLDIITCACPLHPEEKIEHLLIPSIGVGFTTSNSWHKVDFPASRRIHAARFTNDELLRTKKQLLSFNRRAAKELLAEAGTIAAEAKQKHDEMETFSTAAMDWDAVNALTGKVVAEIVALATA